MPEKRKMTTSSEQELISTNPRLHVVSYFESVINKIDINAETLLMREDLNEGEKNKINLTRECMMKCIKEIEAANLSKLQSESDWVKRLSMRLIQCEKKKLNEKIVNKLMNEIFTEYCFYIPSEWYTTLETSHHSKELGRLLVIGRFCSIKEIDYFQNYIGMRTFSPAYSLYRIDTSNVINEVKL